MGDELVDYKMYIGGEFVDGINKNYMSTTNPATGKAWARIPNGDTDDVNKAVDAAKTCFESNEWKRLSPTERGRLLYKLADKITRNSERIAKVETKDNGKLFKEMNSQIKKLPSWFEYYAGLSDKMEGTVIPQTNKNILNYTLKEPLGVVAAFAPWNSPLLLTTFKLAPAIAAGNTVVVKPSENTSASMIEFSKLFDEVGFPPGVLNVVTGYGEKVGEPLSKHKDIDKVAFTGGTETGRSVGKNAISNFSPVTLELGGKSPNIVFEDADLEAAEAGVISGIFAASGQTCIAGSRLFIHEKIANKFLKKLVEKTKNIKLGDPFDKNTQMGPVATVSQLDKIEKFVEIAKDEGAQVLTGGTRESSLDKGLYFRPTILSKVENNHTVSQEEIFGPVLSVILFSNENEVIKKANQSKFGLGAGIWTNDLKKAHRVAHAIESGTVWVNTYRALTFNSPFGGYKNSGVGRENGIEAMFEYMQTKSIWINLSNEIQDPFAIKL